MISVIIPTHNRVNLLKNAIESVLKLIDEAEFEFIIVDNNSTDDTRQLVESYRDYARYAFESRTSFTRARKTGAEIASGDILLYLDDDVIVYPGSLRNIEDVFTRYSDCGVIAGKISPKYTQTPPIWTLKCQESFNGWSLFNKESVGEIKTDFQQVSWAAGPMMAIRKTAYDAVGGFPPDTVGVETNHSKKCFNKLYIGPGDCGLTYKVRQQGWEVYYSEGICADHVIPPIRFTIEFWRSRLIGEGYHTAITQREFYNFDRLHSDYKRKDFQKMFKKFAGRLLDRLNNQEDIFKDGIYPEELWTHYYKAYLDMDAVLRKHPGLSSFLWEIGDKGVDNNSFDEVMGRLPQDYNMLVHSDIVSNPAVLTKDNYQSIFPDLGLHKQRFTSGSEISLLLFGLKIKSKSLLSKFLT
jgi:glycosyltransferase involved in cell wall biosynthesis